MAGAAATLVVIWVATWILSLVIRDASIADVTWGLCFPVVAWVAYALGDGEVTRAAVAAALTSVWGLRLALHIGSQKIREGEEDRRYRAMRERHGSRFALRSLVTIFLLQAVVAWIVALPLYATAVASDDVGVLTWVGVAAWAIGFGFEALGDLQLARFKRDPENAGRLMTSGLWSLTRHPNYFGDVVVWCGLALIALDGGGWWALVSPALMAWLLVRVTGKEMTERHMSSRDGWADYVERTSGFIPLPPRSRPDRRT